MAEKKKQFTYKPGQEPNVALSDKLKVGWRSLEIVAIAHEKDKRRWIATVKEDS